MRTRAALLVAWSRALRVRACSIDDAEVAVAGSDERADEVLRELLLDVAMSPGSIQLALPVPGDVRGLPGAGPWTAAALDAGEAVVTGASVFVPVVEAHGNAIEGFTTYTQWSVFERVGPPAPTPPLAGLADADRSLRAALNDAVELLGHVDVARWSPELAEAVADIRTLRKGGDDFASSLPRSYGPQARELLARARVVGRIIDAALSSSTELIHAQAGRDRAHALQGLAGTVREAICAAINEGDGEWVVPRGSSLQTDAAEPHS